MCLWLSYKKKIWGKNIFFASLSLLGTELDPELDPDPLVRGTDPHQNVTDLQHYKKHNEFALKFRTVFVIVVSCGYVFIEGLETLRKFPFNQ
jgi:hypothetical protein